MNKLRRFLTNLLQKKDHIIYKSMADVEQNTKYTPDWEKTTYVSKNNRKE